MSRAVTAFAVLALLALAPLPSWAESNEAVVTIAGQADFDAALKSSDFVVMEFYAPWCGHCKKLAPEYEKAAGQLNTVDEPKVVLAKVDATDEVNKELASAFDVKGYPTIKMFKNGETRALEYNGPRDSEGIVSYLLSQAGPSASELKAAEDAAKVVEGLEVVAIGLFADIDCAEYKAFTAAADGLREEVPFHYTTSAEILKAAFQSNAEPSVPSVIIFRKFDEPVVAYDGDLTDAAALKAFVEKKSLPLVTTLDSSPKHRDALRKLFSSDLPKALLFADFQSSGSDAVRAAMKEAALSHQGKLLFVEGDIKENEGALKFFGLDMESVPALVIHDTVADLKYRTIEVTPESMPTWLASFATGDLTPHIKSEEIPEDNDGPVKVVVAKSFKELVEDSEKDVFVEFYAPWCGHCKKLAPIWEEIGEHFADMKNLVVAKMDATANDVVSKDYLVKGFPTLFFKQSNGKVLAYSGDRSKTDLIDFVNKHAANQKDHSEL